MASAASPTGSPLFEQFYNFPPFFTLQPTPSTKSRQLDLWTKLLQSHCKQNSQFILTRNEPIFINNSIKRSLTNDFITELFNYMIQNEVALPNVREQPQSSSPRAVKKNPEPTVHDSVIILFIPREKWYEKIYDYAKRNGLVNGGIATAFEILNDSEFSGMDIVVLEGLMNGMMRDKRNCEVMLGDGQMDGVKFF